jgi:hypothetical protein
MHLRQIAGEDGNIVPSGEQTADERLPDESASTSDNDLFHADSVAKNSPA